VNRRFASVEPSIWTSETGREWRHLGAEYWTLGLYLITSPHANQYGLYYLPMVVMVEETGLARASCIAVLQAFTTQDYAFYDERTEWTWIKNMAARQMQLTHQPNPREPRIVGLRKWYESCPGNPFLGAFWDHYHELFGLDERREGSKWTLPKLATVGNGEERSRLVALFEQWFAHYPKPAGKRAALEEWLRLNPPPDDAFTLQCISAVERQKTMPSWIKEGGRYIPEPEAWLRKGRWTDTAPDVPIVTDEDATRIETYGSWIQGHDRS
jgi:hypothetical protein